MGMTDVQAADIAEVSVGFVKKVRRELKNNKTKEEWLPVNVELQG